MAKGYWIVQVDVKNEEAVKRYAAGNHPIFEKFAGRYLVRSRGLRFLKAPPVLGRSWLNFPLCFCARVLSLARVSNQQRVGDGHLVADFVIVEGYDGPQP